MGPWRHAAGGLLRGAGDVVPAIPRREDWAAQPQLGPPCGGQANKQRHHVDPARPPLETRFILSQVNDIAQNYQHSLGRRKRHRGDAPDPANSSSHPAGRVTERGPEQPGRHRQQQQ